ncbi:MAG: DUF2125 domain-containing protein [Gemmobacter sp.]
MRVLLVLVLVAVTVWGAWWWAAATAVERATEGWIAARRAEGWTVDTGGTAVRGFPNRLDLTLTAPRLADPVTGTAWAAPFVQLFALSYRPWHVIAAFPPEQNIDLADGGGLRIAAAKLQASLVVRPSVDLTFDRAALVGDAVELRTPQDTVLMEVLRVGLREAEGRPGVLDLGVEVHRLDPGAAFRAGLPAGTPLPERIATAKLLADIGLTAPLDRHLPYTRPRVSRVELRDGRLDWGSLRIEARGAVSADAAGRAEGRIDITFHDWPLALAAAQAAGWIAPEVAPTWTQALTMLEAAGGTPGTVTLPLAMSGGWMSLGPLPIGAAPRLSN